MIETTRRAVRTLDARPGLGGRLMRVVGSTDFKGQGTEFPVPHLGAFVMVDDARGIEGPDQPPFGLHPHAGLAAVSWFADGGEWIARVGAPVPEALRARAGEVLVTNAGRGVVHEERSAGEGTHAMLQVILRLPRDRSDRDPSMRKVAPVDVGWGVRRLFDGETLADLGLDAAMWQADLAAGVRAPIAVPPAHTAGFVYVREGAVAIGEARLEAGQLALLGAEGSAVLLHAADGPAVAIVGTSAPLDEPWAKLLGHNGFVVGRDPEHVEALMAAYASDPAGFGRRA